MHALSCSSKLEGKRTVRERERERREEGRGGSAKRGVTRNHRTDLLQWQRPAPSRKTLEKIRLKGRKTTREREEGEGERREEEEEEREETETVRGSHYLSLSSGDGLSSS